MEESSNVKDDVQSFLDENCKLIGHAYKTYEPIYLCTLSYETILKNKYDFIKDLLGEDWYINFINNPAFSTIDGHMDKLYYIIFMDSNLAYEKFMLNHEYAHCIYRHFGILCDDKDYLNFENEADNYAKCNFIRIPKLENLTASLYDKCCKNYQLALNLKLIDKKTPVFDEWFEGINHKNYKATLYNGIKSKLEQRELFK